MLIPGTHPQPSGELDFEVSNDVFADDALAVLPQDMLYRAVRTIGLVDGPVGSKQFDPVDLTDGRLLIDEHVRLVEWTRKNDGRPLKRSVRCSKSLSELVLGRAKRSPHTRDLVRLVSYPVYDANFSLCPPGWKDGTYFDVPPELAGLKPETELEVIAQVLDDLVTDFPFSSADDRENFFGLLLTPLLRPAIDGNVPMHLVNAPLERTGKSKLVEEVLGGIVMGRPTPALQLTERDDEVDKRVLALLMAGETLVHLDNLGEFVNSPALASLLTSSVYQGRELGRSTMRRLTNTLIITGSGNNVQLTGELVKRSVPIRLQPLNDQPELRKAFAHPDLRAYVSHVRRDVLAVLLGMVENWSSAGRPAGGKPMGGFESWARIIGGILQVNGYHRWLDNATDWRSQSDPDGEDLKSFVSAWARLPAPREATATELILLAQQEHLFAGVLRGNTASSNLSRFSKKVLARYTGRPVGTQNPSGQWAISRISSGNNTRYQLNPLNGTAGPGKGATMDE